MLNIEKQLKEKQENVIAELEKEQYQTVVFKLWNDIITDLLNNDVAEFKQNMALFNDVIAMADMDKRQSINTYDLLITLLEIICNNYTNEIAIFKKEITSSNLKLLENKNRTGLKGLAEALNEPVSVFDKIKMAEISLGEPLNDIELKKYGKEMKEEIKKNIAEVDKSLEPINEKE